MQDMIAEYVSICFDSDVVYDLDAKTKAQREDAWMLKDKWKKKRRIKYDAG
jgi:hypothetical protein